MTKQLFLASPQGFCAGVQRAILVLEECLVRFGAPVFVNHEIVHNRFLVEHFQALGVVFEPDLDDLPEGSVLVFSAHGVAPAFKKKCAERQLRIIDATCPLVHKVHEEAKRFDDLGYKIILIGHKNHQEVVGSTGVAEMEIVENFDDIADLSVQTYSDAKVVCLTQTTLSVDETADLMVALRDKIPHLERQKDICYATQNRQNAVKLVARDCDFFIIMGSEASSNSNRLVDTARAEGCPARLFEHVAAIPSSIFLYESVGLTSGASVPSVLVEQVVRCFQDQNPSLLIKKSRFVEEHLSFPLPDDLR